MVNTILIILIVLLAVSEIIFGICFTAMHDKINDLRSEYEFCKNIIKINNESTDSVLKVLEAHDKKYKTMVQLTDAINKHQDIFTEQMNLILGNQAALIEHYDKMIDAYHSIESRYGFIYDEFKECNDRLNKIHEKFRHFIGTSADDFLMETCTACDVVCLNCPYEKCLKDTCPVRKLMEHYGFETTKEDLNA